MPRLYPCISNFSSGEWSPKLDGQVQLDKYQHACRQLENFLIQQQGGVIRRPGTRFVVELDARGRLIPFVASVDVTFMLALVPGKIYFFASDFTQVTSGGAPVQVATPYTADQLRDIDVRQSADVLYFFHPDVPTYRLEHYATTIWRFRTVTWSPPPSVEFGARPVFTLTPSATSGSVTLTASGDAFLVSDAPTSPNTTGRDVIVTGGTNAGARANITGFTSSTQVTATVTVPFVDLTATTAGNWKIDGSPLATVTPGAFKPVGTATTLTGGINTWRGVTALADSDCGRFAIVNGGCYEIVTVTSATVAQVIIRGEASSASAATADSWSLEEALWSADNGYGETASFEDDRLYVGAGYRFAGSKSGDYENFAVGTLDDDAIVFALNSDQINTIRWLMGTNRLLIGASGGEFSAFGGNDSPITPSNVQVSGATPFGSNGVGPVRSNNAVLFVNRAGTKLRELVFDWANTNNYVAPDLTLLAEHLTTPAKTIVELAYRQDPDSIVWAMRSDGTLLGLTYLRDQNVVGWHRHTTGSDEFVSVATMPTGSSGDQTWVITKRASRFFVEVMDEIGVCYDYLNTDCTFTCDSAVAVSTFTVGCTTALTGRTCKLVGDGAVYPDQVPVSGTFTIDPPARKVEVGLGYTSTLEIMRPEIAVGAGTMQSMKRRWNEIFVRVLNTLGLTITANGGQPQTIPFRTSATPLGMPPDLFSGDKRLQATGWDEDATVTIQQTQPLPCNVLLLSGLLDVGG